VAAPGAGYAPGPGGQKGAAGGPRYYPREAFSSGRDLEARTDRLPSRSMEERAVRERAL